MQQNINTEQSPDDSSITIRRIGATLFLHWPWFLGAVLVALIIAFVYLRYSTAEYRTSAIVLVQDEGKGGGGVPEGSLLNDLGLGGKSNVENEVEIFKSRTLMEKVVRDLQLNVQYFTQGRIKVQERFYDKSFQLFFVPLFADSIRSKRSYKFQPVDETGFVLSTESEQWKGKWGDTLTISPYLGRLTGQRSIRSQTKRLLSWMR